MARLELYLLGPPQVMLEGRSVARFDSAKVRALLIYMAMAPGRPHRRQSLAALLWPESTEPDARRSLRQCLYSLRRVIGDPSADPPHLLIDRETIRMNPEGDCRVDAMAFAHAIEEEPSQAEALERALALYQGPFLEGFSIADTPEFEEWATLTRERLGRLACNALERLAQLHDKGGEPGLAIESARRLVEMAPLREAAHRLLMRLLAEDGQRGEALRQYADWQRILRDELDAEPGDETQALAERIRDGELGPSAVGHPADLPASLFPLVGREGDLADLVVRLCDPECRLLTLLGAGGVGKTRLATEAMQGAAGRFRDGACFVPLIAVQSSAELLPFVAQGLGLSLQGGAMAEREQLAAYLRRKRLLLVLDSCEHLEGVAALVGHVLASAPDVKVLATSRARLNLPGEELFSLAGLRYEAPGSHLSPDGTERGQNGRWAERSTPASELFAIAARRVRPGYEVATEDAQAVAAICQRVEGMPLPILLAASWMRILGPAEIVAELAEDSGRGIDFLQAEWHGVPEQGRSMRAALDRSWELLSEREREVLAGLSVFRGGFTAEAAQAVAGASLRDLGRLADRSLVYRRASGRYDLHDLLREYATIRLGAMADGGEGVRERHARFYTKAVQRAALAESEVDRAAAEIQAEWDNVRVTWSRAVERGEWRWLVSAAWSLARFSSIYARWGDAAALLRLAEERLRGLLEHARSRTGPVLHAAGAVIGSRAYQDFLIGLWEASIAPARESLALLEEARYVGEDTRECMARNLRRLGDMLSFSDADEAKRCYARAIELAREDSLGQELANALTFSGSFAWRTGNIAQARRQLLEALEIWRTSGNASNHIQCLRLLLNCELGEGEFGQATRWLEEAQAVSRRAGAGRLPPRGRRELAYMLYWLGRFEEAENVFGGEVAFFRERGLQQPLTVALRALGQSESTSGRYREANAHLGEALMRFRDIDNVSGMQLCRLSLGLAALGEGDLAEAERRLQQLTREPTGTRDSYHLFCLLAAPMATLSGCWGEARGALCEALRFRVAAEALPPVALYYATRGDGERAVELYALARTHPFVGNSKLVGDICDQRIYAAASHLPPEVLRAAEDRGRERDWKATVAELLAELESEGT